MSIFTEPLIVQDLGNGRWRVEAGFRYYIGSNHSEVFIDVPDGYETDFFSIPKFVRWLLPKTQHGNQAAVLHDYMCDHVKGLWKWKADVFLEAMTVLEVKPWRRNLMYWSVLAYGAVK